MDPRVVATSPHLQNASRHSTKIGSGTGGEFVGDEGFFFSLSPIFFPFSVFPFSLPLLTPPPSSPLTALQLEQNMKWITLEDVLLSRALAGVRIRIAVWRHELITRIDRFLYLGEVSVEKEVGSLEKRGRMLGLKVCVFHTISSHMPNFSSPYADGGEGFDFFVLFCFVLFCFVLFCFVLVVLFFSFILFYV